MARVRVICGGQRSERTAALDELMRKHWDHALFLLPTRQSASRRAEELILGGDRAGAWGRRATTFQDFLKGLLQSEHSAASGIDEFERRLLLERVVNRLRPQGALDALGDAAASNGFLSHMLRVISDLKQAAIEPADFRARAAKRRHAAPLDAVVASVYEAYQEALRAVNAYDTQGLYWEANLLCERGKPRALAGVKVLLLDGFDDFTPSEFRLLVSLAPHLELMAFGLNCDPERPSRSDLDSIPLETMGRLREQFQAEIDMLGEPEPASFTEFAAGQIFWRDQPPSPSGLLANLELQPCASALHEVETIGRRVKILLLTGTPASEIAVVYRDVALVSGALRSVFTEYGVPVSVHAQPMLGDSAVGTYVLSLLEAVETWTREDVVGIVTSPWFTMAEGVSAQDLSAAPYLSREAHIVEGYVEWDNRLSRLAEAIERSVGAEHKNEAAGDGGAPPGAIAKSAEPSMRGVRRRLSDALRTTRAVQSGLRALKSFSDMLGETASPQVFAQRLDAALESMGLAQAVERAVPAENRPAERNALSALRGALGAVCEWYARDEEVTALPRAEFSARLRQVLRTTPYAYPRAPQGVTCMSADALRGLRFDHVFFAGVNEGDVPRSSAASAIYSDEDVEDLRASGVVIEGRRRRGQRELRVFQHVLEAARTQLCVTWHQTNRNGGEALRSAYVSDLLELFPHDKILNAAPHAAELTPAPQSAASLRELRNAVFARESAQRDAFRNDFAQAFLGVAIEKRRHASGSFDAFDGVLEDAGRIAALAQRYGASHPFSVNQIEAYLACPFQFFTARVLGIEEAETPVAEFDDRVRGVILHTVLERFHRHYTGVSVVDIPETDAEQTLHGIVEDVFDTRAWRSVTAPPGVVEVEKRRMANQVKRYLRLARERDGESLWKPANFEVAFGGGETPSGDELTRAEAYTLETSFGPVLFSGRIDRVDLHEGRARIVDYKTSYAPPAKDIKEGLAIQLSVYALALEEFLKPGSDCAEAYYVPVGKKSWAEGLGKAKVLWDERAALARSQVADSVAGIRAGRFAPVPARTQCSRCASRRPCRYEAGRIERKTVERHEQDA